MNKDYEALTNHLDRTMAFKTALTLFEWDGETLSPEKAMELTSKTIGILSNEYFSSLINDEVKGLLLKLEGEGQDELTFNEKAILKHLKKTFDELEPIPPKEYQANKELLAKAPGIWAKAKAKQSFDDFAPCLEELINYQKKFVNYRASAGKTGENCSGFYDILLNDYEEDFNTKVLDEFFGKMKDNILPLIKEIAKKRDTIDKTYNHQTYDLEKQRAFCKFISGYVGFDSSRGVIAESAHPFTTNLHNKDVRITDHFYENNLESGIFSMIHESGHAIYEMHIDDAITMTLVGTGTSMGMHESQSRFFENIIGRSEAFWVPLYPKLKETFPEQLKDVTFDHFIKGINKAAPNLIRTEADELTYSLHIIIRYEIEKMIFDGDVKVKDLPAIWNQKYEEYLGLTPANDSEGILQDIHWACGNFGYFPSYAVGSAIASQIAAYMKSVMPMEEYLKEGNITPIREFLNHHIHQYGATKNTNELLMGMMGEAFNPDYYIQYLKDKFTKLYGLE